MDGLSHPQRTTSPALERALTSWAVLQHAPVGLYVCDLNGVIVRANANALALCGALDPAEAYTAQTLRTGEPVRDFELLLERPGAASRTIIVNVDPLFDDSGAQIGAVTSVQDVTPLKQAEQQIRDGDAKLRALLDALPAAIYTTDADGVVTAYNRAAADLAGREPQIGADRWCVSWQMRTLDGLPLPLSECPMAQSLRSGAPIRNVEAIVVRPDGTCVPVRPYPTPLHDEGGNLIGGINMLIDVSDRKTAEGRQRNLVDELNHRVKNTLSSVQSLAAQSFARDCATPAARAAFEQRLLALSKAHNQLARNAWESADFKLIAEDVTGGHAGRVRLSGPSAALAPHAALTLAMVVHELTANAASYGALSNGAGVVDLAWRLEQGDFGKRLKIDWCESGGPIVSAPARRGFGRRLVESGLRADLDGAADIVFDPSGLRCSLTASLAGSSV